MNIAIIGAGPIGCYAGYRLAKSGHSVDIYEKKAEIGLPVQCTGIITADLDKFGFLLEEFLVNRVNKIDVFTPHQTLSTKQKDYIICRKKFDNYLASLARKAGARIHLNHFFLQKEGDNIIIKDLINNQQKIIIPQIIIAADGPLSPTAKAYGFYHPKRTNYYGIQATVEGSFAPDTVKTYFGNDVCPGLFAWIVPESATIARVGLASGKNSKYYFDQFMRKNDFTVKEIQAGTIPLYHPKQKLRKGNCYLVGDAASFVKATTLGGIIPGLKQAEILVECLNQGKDYEKELRPLRREMNLHLRIQRIISRFSDKDWDKLAFYINQPKIKELFERYSRDEPIPLVAKALWKEPRFLRFGKYLF